MKSLNVDARVKMSIIYILVSCLMLVTFTESFAEEKSQKKEVNTNQQPLNRIIESLPDNIYIENISDFGGYLIYTTDPLGNAEGLTFIKPPITTSSSRCSINSDCPVQKPYLANEGGNQFCTERCGTNCRSYSGCPTNLRKLNCVNSECNCQAICPNVQDKGN